MISTLHGNLPLLLKPAPGLQLSEGGRVELCTVRGEALGQRLNVQLTLDVNTGEVLVMSPDNFVGCFRIGDLIAAHMQTRVSHAMRELRDQEAADAQTH